MKTSKLIIIALLVSAYATVSVINIELAKPKDVSEVTLDMLDIMSRAFNESEGGEAGACPTFGSVSYGGYETTGIRQHNTGSSWGFETSIEGELKLHLFGSESEAEEEANKISAGITVSMIEWHDYSCDPGSTQVCWVCNAYPLNGPGGPL